METARTARLAALALSVAAVPAWAGAYKCQGPDGQILYQQTPCPDEGAAMRLDANPAGKAKTPTVESQVKALESAKGKARRESKETAAEARPTPSGTDVARCAKERAEAARWRKETKKGYRDRDERDRRERMLEYHEALIQRYCPSER